MSASDPVVALERGEYVETWFDTGAMGCQILYGRVVAAGRKVYRVKWESGLSNRLSQDRVDVRRARDINAARDAMAKWFARAEAGIP